MRLVRIGRRRINLDYLIYDEEPDGTPATADIPPGGYKVVLETGDPIILEGEDAEAYRRATVGMAALSVAAPAPPPADPPARGHARPTRAAPGVYPAVRPGKGGGDGGAVPPGG